MNYSKLLPIRVHLFGYVFSPSLVPTIATLVLLPLLIGLGIWQLHRAQEKRLLEENYATQTKTMHIAEITNPNNKALNYHPLELTGDFDNRYTLFIDNQIYQHQAGFYVLTPFHIDGTQQYLWVNRGFIPIQNREQLPSVAPLLGKRTITGLINFPSKAFMLKKDQITTKWPKVLQSIDLNLLNKIFKQNNYPFIVLQNSLDESQLIRKWHPVSFPSYRHKGYAIQWFSLALTLLIIYITLNLSRRK